MASLARFEEVSRTDPGSLGTEVAKLSKLGVEVLRSATDQELALLGPVLERVEHLRNIQDALPSEVVEVTPTTERDLREIPGVYDDLDRQFAMAEDGVAGVQGRLDQTRAEGQTE